MHERSRLPRRLIAAGSVLVLAFLGLALFRVGPPPALEIEAARPGIGPATPILVRASEAGRGLSALSVELVQGDRVWTLEERSYSPRPFWAFWGARTTADELTVEVGKRAQPELTPGEATLRVRAGRAPTWLRHPEPAVLAEVLPVRLAPPLLAVLSRPNIVTQGGSGAVVYRVGDGVVVDGVAVGGAFFPGYPLAAAGGEARRFSLFAAPYDLEPGGGASASFRLVAEDELGNRTEVPFLDTWRPQPPTSDSIELSDEFMARVVPEILAHSPQIEGRGDLLADYLAVNGELRRANAETLARLAGESRQAFLWQRPFRQLGSSQVMASFADRRTYRYQGRVVDHQDHLGYDLASSSRAPVGAAAPGVVALAEYLGIYGNTVVLDHGYGLASLYAHLSAIEVAPGQEVEEGQRLGLTGQTGLAGGDHLHFSILLHGHFVNPLEWWDPRWVRDRVRGKLGLEPSP